MNNGNKVVKVIELKGELGSLEKSLSTLRQNLSGLQLPKDVEKTFSGLDEIIKTLQHRVSEGIISREEFKVVEKEIGQVVKRFGELAGSVESIQQLSAARKLSLLPEDAKEKLQAATSAMEQYSSTLSSIIKLENEQAAASERVANAEARVKAAETNEKAAKKAVDTIQAQIDKHAELTAALEEQEKAEKQYADAVKQLEKAKTSGMGAKAIKNRESKVAQADAEREKARLVVSLTKEGMEPEEIRAYEEAISALTEKKKEYAAASRELADAQKVQTEAQGTLATIQTQLKQATEDGADGAKEQKEAYETLLKAIKQINPEFEDVAEAGETTTERLARLSKIVEGLSDEELKKLEQSLGGVSGTVKETQDAVDGLSGSLQNVKKETKESDDEAGKVQNLEQRIKAFLGIQGAVELMRRAMRDAFATVKELDSAMREMAVVTDLSVGDYWGQLPQYAERASNLGVSIKSAYEAATLYYQQGLKTNEVTALSAETLKMASIANIDAAEATNKMTAALRGFNMELNETSAQRIADVYSELAAITAADVDQISSAMTKTASIASSAGMEFETTAAFLSQIIETTQESAETAGTAMKTVIARFQELKKAPSEIGEVDGEIVDANAIETALRSVGVSLRDASGQFRELDDVFLELSSKWDGLDKNTQRYIATIAAGSRQQSRFIAMMSNYGRTQELVSAANNSAGASAKQYEKTLESLEAKLNKLKNAWDQFTMGIMNDDLVKFGVDILTKFLEVVNKATDGLDSIGNSITKIASVLVIFKTGSKIFEKFKPMIHKFLSGVIKEFHDAGFNAGKGFTEGVKAGTTGEKPKEDKPEMSEEEKKKKEKRLQEVRMASQMQARGEVRGAKEIPGALLSGATQPFRSAAGAAKGVASGIADRQQLKKKRNYLAGEIEGTKRTRDYLQGQAMTSGPSVPPELAQRIKEIEAELAEKEAQLRGMDAQIESGSIGTKAKQAISGGWQKLSGGHFDVAGSRKKEMDRLAGQMARRDQLGAESDNRQARMAQLERDRVEAMRQEDAARKKKFSARGTSGEGAAETELLKRKKALQAIEEEQRNLQKEEQEYQDLVAEGSAIEEEFNKNSEEYLKEQEEGWKTIGDNVKKAGECVTGAGVAMSMLGGIFEELGLTELGEAFSTVGQYVTMFGSALTMLGPAITMIGNLGTSVATKLTTAGWSTQAAWWWVALIAIAVMALIAGIILLVNYLNNNSPEKKLEKAQEAADKAGEAADQAAERYEKLNDALEQLDDKYDSLNELTKGTKEWNAAMQEVNDSVLDLIEEFPHLAKYVKNVDGVLTIDTESEEVQAELEKAQAGAQMARINAMNANIGVAEAQQKVDFANLDAVNKLASKSGWSSGGATALAAGGYGAAIGSVAGPIGAAIGGVVGAIGGLAVGLITSSQVKSDEKIQSAVEELAKEAETNVDMTKEEMQSFLEGKGMLADQAKILAEEFSTEEGRKALRDFGDSVENISAKTDAAAMAMASAAQELANIDNWTLDEQTIAANMVNENTMKELLKDEKDKASGSFDEKETKNLKEEDKADLLAVMKQQYGESATLDEKTGQVKFRDAEGKDQTATFTKDELVSMVANYRATNRAVAAKEASKKATSVLSEQLGLDEELVKRMYLEREGGAITRADLEALKAKDTDANTEDFQFNATEMWEGFDQAMKDVFGSQETLEDYLKTTVKEADAAFAKGDEVFDNLGLTVGDTLKSVSSDAYQGIAEKMQEINERNINAKDDGTINAIFENIQTQLGEIAPEKVEEAMALISATDWTSQEELRRMEMELISRYGLQKDAVEGLVGSIIEANFATSTLTTVISTFGELERASLKLNKALAKQSELQWELDKAMSEGDVASVKGAYSGLISNLNNQLDAKKGVVLGAKTNLAKAIAQGGDVTKFGTDLREYINVGEDGTVDTSDVMQKLEQGAFGNKTQAVEDWLKLINESQDTLQEAEEDVREHLATIEELESQGAEAYNELREMAESAILDSLQKQIDIEQDTLDATRDANALLINKIQEQIDDTREARQKEEAEKNISNMYSQMAYLSSDTSGANALTLLGQEEALKQAEQDYQDTLIDQSLQNLQDANAKAEEQRERQIALAQQQLDAYTSSGEFQDHVDAQLAEMLAADDWMESNLGGLIVDNATQGMNDSQIDGYLKGMEGKVGLAQSWEGTDWATYKTDLEAKLGEVKDAISTINLDASELKVAQQKAELSAAGFDSETIKGLTGDEGEKKLDNLSKFVARENAGGSMATSQNQLKEAGINDVKSKGDYYKENFDNIADGKDVNTYEEYLTDQVSKNKSKAITDTASYYNMSIDYESFKNSKAYQDNLKKYEALGGSTSEFETQIKEEKLKDLSNYYKPIPIKRSGWNNGANRNFDLTVGDVTSEYVKTGDAVQNSLQKLLTNAMELLNEAGDGNIHAVRYNNKLYMRDKVGSTWYPVEREEKSGKKKEQESIDAYNALMAKVKSYKTGGLADFTGPAWLDGTPSKPEYILNAKQTERFFSLIDVLESVDNKDGTGISGDTYFDIDINVEKLDNDYDIERVADKIRRMITEDASYRNVNAINKIR